MSFSLADLETFNATVFKTIELAFTSGMQVDVLSAVGSVTGAVASRGLDPAQDMNALQSINKIVADLVAAKAQATA